MQYQWDDGRNTATALIDKKIKNSKGETKLDDTVSYSDFAKLGFNEEWVSAFKQKSIAKKTLEEATKELTLAQASVSAASTPDEKRDAELRYKRAYEEYDKDKAASETADKVKAAMDKKHSRDAQRFDNYKYYSKNDKSRPGNIYAESNVPKSSSTQGSTPESNSQPEQTSIPDSDEHAGEQQTTSTNINQSILDDDNFDRGFAATDDNLKSNARDEKESLKERDNSGINSNRSLLGEHQQQEVNDSPEELTPEMQAIWNTLRASGKLDERNFKGYARFRGLPEDDVEKFWQIIKKYYKKH